MKTPATINRIAILFSAAILAAVPGHAAQNFSQTYNYSTGDSNAGMTASLFAFDDVTRPTSSTSPATYTVTAGCNVKGRVLGSTTTAADGRGTMKVQINRLPNLAEKLTANFSGTLKVLGTSVLNVSNINPGSYGSPHFVKQWKVSKTITVSGIRVNAKVTTSVDAQLQATAAITQPTRLNLGEPKVAFSLVPVVDLVAVTEPGPIAVLPGLAGLTGAGSTVRLGKVALKANASVKPILEVVPVNGLELFPPQIIGATADVLLVTETRGTNASVTVTTTRLGPVQYTLF